MASTTGFLVFVLIVSAIVQSIEAWLPPYFPGYPGFIPGFNPGYNPYLPGLPFVPGYPGAPPLNYDVNHMIDHSSSECSDRQHLHDRSHSSDPHASSTSPPTPFFGSALGAAFSPINWLFRKWPVNVPPVTTHYYNTGNGNEWGKLKTWSWQF